MLKRGEKASHQHTPESPESWRCDPAQVTSPKQNQDALFQPPRKKSDFLRASCTDGLNYLLPDRESRGRGGKGKKNNSRGKSVQENERAADEPQLSEALTKAQLLRAPAVPEILIAALPI